MKVLFYIEPLTERDSPAWKKAWVGYVEQMITSLGGEISEARFCCVIGDGLEDEAKRRLTDCNVACIHHTELVPKFGSSALAAAMKWYRGASIEELHSMGELVKQRINPFVPDVCISFSAAPFIKAAFPDIPVLHFELGIVSRPPFPMTAYLDPLGMFNNSYPLRYQDEIRNYQPAADERRVVAAIRNTYLPYISQTNPLADIVKPKLRNFKTSILVALQFSQFYGYDAHADYPDQYDLLIQTLVSVPKDTAVIVVEHPQYPILSDDTVNYLAGKYENFIWTPEFRSAPSASQYLMEFADCVVTVSSSVGLQTLLWRKRLIVLGHSHLDAIADAHDLADLHDLLVQPWPEYKEHVLAWHLTRYSIPFSLLFERGVVSERIRCALACVLKNGQYHDYFANPYADIQEINFFYERGEKLQTLQQELEHIKTEYNRQIDSLNQPLVDPNQAVNERHGKIASLSEETVRRDEWALRLNAELKTVPAEARRETAGGKLVGHTAQIARGSDIAVVLHLFHTDLWDEFRSALQSIGRPFDLFVSVQEDDYPEWSEIVGREFPSARMFVFPNRGRDVLPFLKILSLIRPLGYRFFLKLHTKKSLHLRGVGESWRKATLLSLAGWRQRVDDILNLYAENPKLGLFAPYGYLLNASCRDRNWLRVKEIGARMDCVLDDDREFSFPGGTMFWARTEALDPLLDLGLEETDFEEEAGQLDCTLAHAAERLFGLSARLAGLEVGDRLLGTDDVPYVVEEWLKRRQPNGGELAFRVERTADWAHRPVFHFVLALVDGEQSALADTLDSIAAQCYEHWRLSVVSTLPCPDPLFDELPQLAWHRFDPVTARAEAINASVNAVEADWVGILRPGGRLETHALLCLAEAVRCRPDWKLIYADEDHVSEEGHFHSPNFKPDVNFDLLRSMAYIGQFVFIRRDALLAMGGYAALEGAENYDATFKLLESYGEISIGHVAHVLYHQPDFASAVSKDICERNQREALIRHLRRRDVRAEVKAGLLPGTFFIDYPLTATPLVSIVVPTKDRLDLLQPCIDSVLRKTRYPSFEVLIVDNRSTEPATLQYLEKISQDSPCVRVLGYPKEYNFAAINNWAVREAKGEYVLLLNNDTLVLQENWLERLMALGLRSEVGITGVRLVYPNQLLQHAGVILGMGPFGIADHWHIGLDMRQPGYQNRAQVVQNFSAVTAACMLVRRSVYEEVGGMDEDRFKVLFNDVDLCLKVGEAGYKIVWTPFVTLLHHGSSSIGANAGPADRERARGEIEHMLAKWLPKLADDPAFNRNLSLRERTPTTEVQTNVSWDSDVHCRPRIWAFPCDSFGVGEYRVRAPLRALNREGFVQTGLLPDHDQAVPVIPTLAEFERAKPDVVFLQNGVSDAFVQAFQAFKKYGDAFLVYGQDDLMFMLPQNHPGRETIFKDYRKRLRKVLKFADRLVVATEPLAEAMRDMIEDVRIVPNRLEKARWGDLAFAAKRRQGKKPRVGWAGGPQHLPDLEILIPVIEATAQDVDWIFFGVCPDSVRSLVAEFHPPVLFHQYPARLASLNLDLAVAPLARNKFNEAKSNLKLLEYGILGYSVICTDIFPYQRMNAPVCRLPNIAKSWIDAIYERVADPDATEREGDTLRTWVLDHWILDDHLDQWYDALVPQGKAFRV